MIDLIFGIVVTGLTLFMIINTLRNPQDSVISRFLEEVFSTLKYIWIHEPGKGSIEKIANFSFILFLFVLFIGGLIYALVIELKDRPYALEVFLSLLLLPFLFLITGKFSKSFTLTS